MDVAAWRVIAPKSWVLQEDVAWLVQILLDQFGTDVPISRSLDCCSWVYPAIQSTTINHRSLVAIAHRVRNDHSSKPIAKSPPQHESFAPASARQSCPCRKERKKSQENTSTSFVLCSSFRCQLSTYHVIRALLCSSPVSTK